MKQATLPILGLLVVALTTVATPHSRRSELATPVATVRHESAGGTVTLPTADGDSIVDDDDATRASARATLRENEAGTYITEILAERDSALARWHSRPDKPVTIWVQRGMGIPDWDDQYLTAVDNAFLEWNTVDLPVRFQIVSDSAKAEVHVTWVDRFDEPISGRTRWSRDDRWWIINASIVLAVHHQQGEILDQSAMKAMALHEVGHLLGLDHTTNAGSIMAPRVRVRSLTDVDRATVRLLYAVPAGTLR